MSVGIKFSQVAKGGRRIGSPSIAFRRESLLRETERMDGGMSLSVELVWAEYCPNVEESRRLIREALRQLDLPLRWQEWEVGERGMPEHCQGYGSPTILVNGVDVLAQAKVEWTAGCAVYSNVYNARGVPTFEEVIGAFQAAH